VCASDLVFGWELVTDSDDAVDRPVARADEPGLGTADQRRSPGSCRAVRPWGTRIDRIEPGPLSGRSVCRRMKTRRGCRRVVLPQATAATPPPFQVGDGAPWRIRRRWAVARVSSRRGHRRGASGCTVGDGVRRGVRHLSGRCVGPIRRADARTDWGDGLRLDRVGPSRVNRSAADSTDSRRTLIRVRLRPCWFGWCSRRTIC